MAGETNTQGASVAAATYADLPANSTSGASVAVGGSYSGSLETVGDIDWIAVSLVAGQTYTIALNGSGVSPLADPYLRIYAPGSSSRATGTLVGEDDDGGPGTNSSITFTAGSTGVFYIDVAAWDNVFAGGYTVEVQATVPLDNTDTWTLQQIADYLRAGYWGGSQRSFAVGVDNAISVDVSALGGTYQAYALTALQTWTDIIGVQFSVVTSAAEITFTQNGTESAFSTSSLAGTQITSSMVNISTDWVTVSGADYTLQTFIHEIGHALGLGHAGDYNGSASYGVDNLYANDSWQATVMSYFSQTENTAVNASFAYLLTPMLADIIAITDLYGYGTTTRTGDTIYGYNGNAGPAFTAAVLDGIGIGYALTIVDQGGADTIDLSGSTHSNRLDLAPGSVSDTGGLVGNLSISFDTIIENAIGGSGADTLTGNDADNVLSGRGGADHLDGGGNGAMGDTASYAGSAAGVTVNLNTGAGTGGDAEGDTLVNIENLIGSPFADRLTGNGAVNRLWGGDGNDLLNASLAGDFLYGEGGDDTLIGGQGADLLDGGANGAAGDTASYSNSAAGVTVDLGAGTASGGDAEGDTLTDIENLIGSAQADTLTGDGNANALTGGDGGDTLAGGGGADTLYGNNGDDMLVGGDGADYLHGGAGSDTVSYAGGAVGVTARIGITGSGGEAEGDVYMAVENFIGTDQDDRLDGSVAVNRLQGMGGNDYLVGGDASDILEGGDGNDTLVGGNGGDTLDGGDGVDTANYYSSTTGVWVNLLAGTASLGHASGDTLVSIENVTGSYAGANRLTGDNGDNVLIGYAGADRLTGNGGNDTLYGGNDTVRDLFIYSSAGFGQDSVRQFHNGEDIIDLRGLGLTFADVHAVQSGTSTVLTFTGLAGDQITLTSFTATNIDATDFYF